MSSKLYDIDGLGSVRLQKRRGTRHLRLTLTAQGEIRVSLPPWVPYRLGLEFVKNKQAWILQHRPTSQALRHGQAIGKAHRLALIPSRTAKRSSSRLVGQSVRVTYPAHIRTTDNTVQQAAQRGALKALQQEAESLLPGRLQSLAQKHGFQYRNLRIRHLRSKWGSCDQNANITLNIFLMTLPWELIDYVLLHELMHTKVLRHGQPFWHEMKKVLPAVQAHRQRLRKRQPSFSSL